jgi:hypothetical protein
MKAYGLPSRFGRIKPDKKANTRRIWKRRARLSLAIIASRLEE